MPLYEPNTRMRTIGVEEHFATRAWLDGPGVGMRDGKGYGQVVAEMLDIGDGRIAAMDAAGIDVHVLSLCAPGVEQLDTALAIDLARNTNDLLAVAVKKHPHRLAAFATLPIGDPAAAAAELRRAHVELGFPGAVINGHNRGRYLDNEMFSPVLSTAQELGVPLFLHPTAPPPAVLEASYTGNFSQTISFRLGIAGWGWHLETGTHALRMILGGVFDRFPNLQVIIGHHGEVLPFLVPRIERNFPQSDTGLQRPIRAYLRENFYYTFGGWNWTSMFTALRHVVEMDRILFATDYPWASMEEAHRFLHLLEVSDDERELIAHRNAESLLGLPSV